MAAAFFNALADPTLARGVSAGTEPGPRVHPEVVAAMNEVGIDLSDVKPQIITTQMATEAGYLVTMGCGAVCPIIPHLKRADWPLEDPKGKPIENVREIRDEIRTRVERLVENMGWKAPTLPQGERM
jgi:arsenate reductase